MLRLKWKRNKNLHTGIISGWLENWRKNKVSAIEFANILRSYAAQLSSYRDHCDGILKEVESALNHLQDLQHKHLLVSTKTGALHEACEQLLQDQVREMFHLTPDLYM